MHGSGRQFNMHAASNDRRATRAHTRRLGLAWPKSLRRRVPSPSHTHTRRYTFFYASMGSQGRSQARRLAPNLAVDGRAPIRDARGDGGDPLAAANGGTG